MSESTESAPLFGSPELRLPDDLRGPLKAHMENLRNRYVEMGWAGRGGFGSKPALIVIDLAFIVIIDAVVARVPVTVGVAVGLVVVDILAVVLVV